MTIVIRSKSRRSTTNRRRDTDSLNALHRLKLRNIVSNIESTILLLPQVRDKPQIRGILIAALVQQYFEALRILVVEVPEARQIRAQIIRINFELMENHLWNIGVPCSERFRFQSFDDMRQILRAFRFPEGYIIIEPGSYHMKTTAEEMLLISLTRLSFPIRWNDVLERFPGRDRQFMQRVFYWFLDFMITNWAYLLVNNLEWWKPRFQESCDAIREKLQHLNHMNWRLFFQRRISSCFFY